MENWWVNYQKAGDFNPLHKHTGIYSFVIWLKVPTDSKEQNDLPIGQNRNGNVISDFEISYTDISGRMRSYVYKMSKNIEMNIGLLIFITKIIVLIILIINGVFKLMHLLTCSCCLAGVDVVSQEM